MREERKKEKRRRDVYVICLFIRIDYHFHSLDLSLPFTSSSFFFSTIQHFEMKPTSPETLKTPYRGSDGGIDNRSFTRSSTESPAPRASEYEKLDDDTPPRAKSASATPFSVIREIPGDIMGTIKSTGAPPSASSFGYKRHLNLRSTESKPYERQLSLLDPMSDRVSTILVWQHLTVQIREDKKKEAFHRMKSYKTFVPKRKCLLNNISGAITGGLWAVMGKFFILKVYYSL